MLDNLDKIEYAKKAGLDKEKIPEHIGIIMDGNGRWAQKKGFPRLMGHKAGLENLKTIIKECNYLGVKVVTVYAFSTENWKRPPEEVKFLMNLLVEYMRKEIQELKDENVRIYVLGERDLISAKVQKEIDISIEETKENTGLKFNIAFNYGGRAELLHAIKKIALNLKAGNIEENEINEELIADELYTHGDPDPDLIIRTSGELRLSNFLIWQSAYSELYFTDIMWPDFGVDEIRKAIEDFSGRKRRFGGLKETKIED